MTGLPALLPTNYADGQAVHATTDDASGGGIDAWMTAINALITMLGGEGVTVATLSTPALTNPTINGYTELVQALGTCSSSKTIGALTNGTVVTGTLTSATACTFTMPTATAGTSFLLILHQPASGTATTATFTGVKWPGGTAPTITATLSAVDILSFVADGSYWYGTFVQAFA